METLFKVMIDESDPALPFGYLKVNEVFRIHEICY